MQHIHNTVAALKRGEVVLVPTDTNYARRQTRGILTPARKFTISKTRTTETADAFVAEPAQAWDYIAVDKVSTALRSTN